MMKNSKQIIQPERNQTANVVRGIASGATMEGLDLALAAEGIDKDIKEYWYHFGRENIGNSFHYIFIKIID